MRSIFFSLCAILLLSSCMELAFRESMPANSPDLNEFPEELRGVFVSKNDQFDTLEITSKWVSETKFTLNKDNVLRKTGKYYVCSQNKGDRWNLGIIRLNGRKGFTLYGFDVKDKKSRKSVESILPITEVKDAEGTLDYLLVSPSDEEFAKLLKSRAFVKAERFYRIR